MNSPTHPAIEEARLAGFDMILMDINLSLSPAEHWHQHDLALDVMEELRNAKIIRDAGLHAAAPTSR